MKRRLCALFCALMLLCVHLTGALALTEGDIYFTSVNDTLLPLSMTSMPVWVNGMLYVPASVFDRSATGSDLSLFYNYNRGAGMLTLYTIEHMLIFDLNRGVVYNQHSGENLSPRAVTRNGQTYLPVELVCDFFSLEDSYTYTQYGYLVRIKDNNASLSDARFLDAAGSIMSQRLNALMEAQKSASPAPEGGKDSQPVVTPPGGETTDGGIQNETQVCLGFFCESGEGLEKLLNILDRNQCRALFLLTPQVIREQDDLVRRIVGSGHTVGLAGQDEDELAEGNAALAHVARTAATVALAEKERQPELEAQGWICWNETASAVPRGGERPSAFAQRVVQSLRTGRRTVYLTGDDSAECTAALSALLAQLEAKNYMIVTPLESRL